MKVARTAACLACLAVLVGGCGKDPPKSDRWDKAAASAVASAASAPTAPLASAVAAGSLNRFFPKDGEGGYKRVFTADKEGFAEAKLQKDGKDVATLSVADTARTPDVKGKFDGVTENVGGFPVVKVGNNQTSALVKERFQVKVSSPTIDHEGRKAILATFDLKGLGS